MKISGNLVCETQVISIGPHSKVLMTAGSFAFGSIYKSTQNVEVKQFVSLRQFMNFDENCKSCAKLL